MLKALGVIVLLCVVRLGFSWDGCPEPEFIEPCQCQKYIGFGNNLLCENITNEQDLKKVFEHSKGYSFRQVTIQNSVSQHLPYNLFKDVSIDILYLKRVVLNKLFDRVPEPPHGLIYIKIDECKILRGISWKILEPFSELVKLVLEYTPIKTLNSDFSSYAPKSLRSLQLHATKTNTFKPGTFLNLKDLQTLQVDSCNLRSLTRDMFSTPFNCEYLSFKDNKLSKIPEGLFTQMPILRYLDLSKNPISTLSYEAFDRFKTVEYLYMHGNPLKCDCRLVWLVNNKPRRLEASCETPKRLQGNQLRDLHSSDFPC